jgi:hypothetical protein
MRKLITLTLAVLMVGLFAAVVFAAVEAGDDSSSTVGTTETSPTTETTETTTTDDDAPAGGLDVSGPCDEAEHANDPRCTGVTPRLEDDDARGDDRDEGERHDNSGPGNGDDDSGRDDDRSGHGDGDDD